MNIRYVVARLVDDVINSVNQENSIRQEEYNTAMSQIKYQRTLMESGEIDRADVEEPQPPKLVKIKSHGKLVDNITRQLEELLDPETAASTDGVEVENAPKGNAQPDKPQEGTQEGTSEGVGDGAGGAQVVNAEQNPSSGNDSATGESRRGDIGNTPARKGVPEAPRKAGR
jgi:hypothetical protein